MTIEFISKTNIYVLAIPMENKWIILCICTIYIVMKFFKYKNDNIHEIDLRFKLFLSYTNIIMFYFSRYVFQFLFKLHLK